MANENNIAIANIESDGFFNSTEQAMMNKNLKIRDQIIDKMTGDGEDIPIDNSTIRVLKEVIESSDNAIIKTAELRARQDDNNKLGAMTDVIAATLKQAATGAGSGEVVDRKVFVDDDFIPVDVVPGEMEISAKPLSLEDFGDKKEED